jgi:hypothetical protein
MKLSPKKQQGMTLISMTCIAIVVGAIFFLAITIFPIYMDHGKVKGALDSIKQTAEASGGGESPEQISSRLNKILGMNNVDNLITKDNVTITRDESGHTKINIQYEVVKKIVSNASILVEFDDTVEISK